MYKIYMTSSEAMTSSTHSFAYTVEHRYNEVFGTMKITLLYLVSHYIR